MKIDAQNIEEVIFDFHEGNLSDPEKAALMDFMHKNPEYEREFALWAKSYHYASEPVPEYGQDERFVKTHYPAYAKWAGVATGIGLVALATWWWWPTNTTAPSQIREEKGIEKVEKAMTISLSPYADQKIKSTERTSLVSEKKGGEMSSNTTDLKEKTEEKIVTSDTVMILDQVPSMQHVVDSVITPNMHPQTSDGELKKEQKEKQLPSTTAKKPKRKRKMDLTPTDDILPFNSDF